MMMHVACAVSRRHVRLVQVRYICSMVSCCHDGQVCVRGRPLWGKYSRREAVLSIARLYITLLREA